MADAFYCIGHWCCALYTSRLRPCKPLTRRRRIHKAILDIQPPTPSVLALASHRTGSLKVILCLQRATSASQYMTQNAGKGSGFLGPGSWNALGREHCYCLSWLRHCNGYWRFWLLDFVRGRFGIPSVWSLHLSSHIRSHSVVSGVQCSDSLSDVCKTPG